MLILIILLLLSLLVLGVFIYIRMQVSFICTFAFIIFLFFISGVYIIREGQQVVITQFGEIIGAPHTQAGLYLKVPFIWKAHYFDKRLMTNGEFRANVPTKDGYLISVDAMYLWKIGDAKLFINTVGSEKTARIILRNVISGDIRQAISELNFIETIRTKTITQQKPQKNIIPNISDYHLLGVANSIKVGRVKLINRIQDRANKYLSQFGIQIPGIYILNLRYQNSVLTMIYKRMIQERLREAEKLRSQGRSHEKYILGEMKVKYNEIIAPATKSALQIIGDARAEEARIKALSFGQDIEFYEFWRTLLSYQEGLHKGAKNAILSTDSQFLKLLSNPSFDKKPKRQ